MRVWWVVVMLGLLLGACSDDRRDAPEAPRQDLATQGPAVCPGQDAPSSSDARGGTLTGDIDGDGSDDVVYIVEDPGAEPGCRFLLVVETGRGPTLSVPVDTGDVSPIGGLPALRSLAHIDERPGAEIVVDVLAGASTTFAAIYSAGGEELERMTLPEGAPYGDLFPYGGSVGHMESSACGKEGGTVTIGSLVPQGDRYLVAETVYRSEDGRFEETEVVSDTIANLDDLGGRFGSFAASPFGNCPAAG